MDEQIDINIIIEQDIVVARQKGRALARELGFSVVDQCRIATCISELARNIFHYAGRGIIRLKPLNDGNRFGVEVEALDCGPGISDVKLAMLDGFSTSNGLGMGLPGTQRLMDEFYLASELGKGTIVTVRKWHLLEKTF